MTFAISYEVNWMNKFVIGPDVARRLAQENVQLADEKQLLAPTLMRSQLLAQLYQAVRQKEMSREEANRCLQYVRGLRMRLLGDRVLQSVAWKVAAQLDWTDTLTAEYIALTQLQADAFITLDAGLAAAVKEIVTVVPYELLVD